MTSVPEYPWSPLWCDYSSSPTGRTRHFLLCSFLGGFELIYPALWAFLSLHPRQSLDGGASPRRLLLLAPGVPQASLLSTDKKTGLRGERTCHVPSKRPQTYPRQPDSLQVTASQLLPSDPKQATSFSWIGEASVLIECTIFQASPTPAGKGPGWAPKRLQGLLIFSWPLCSAMKHSQMSYYSDSPGTAK